MYRLPPRAEGRIERLSDPAHFTMDAEASIKLTASLHEPQRR